MTKPPTSDAAGAVLLPCPFCGCSAVVQELEWPKGKVDAYSIVCLSDECDGTQYARDTREDAIAAWNRRTPQPPPEAGSVGVPEGWQPIETAPKDGTVILLGCAKHQSVIRAWWNGAGWSSPTANDGADHLCSSGPQSWMPLPNAPAKQRLSDKAKPSESSAGEILRRQMDKAYEFAAISAAPAPMPPSAPVRQPTPYTTLDCVATDGCKASVQAAAPAPKESP